MRLGEPRAQGPGRALAVASQTQGCGPRPRPDHYESREPTGLELAGRADETCPSIHPRKRKPDLIRDGLDRGETYSLRRCCPGYRGRFHIDCLGVERLA